LVVWIHHRQVFWLVENVHVFDFEIHAFFEQHDAATLAEWTGNP